MVEQQISQTQINPKVGDKLKSAVGLGDTVRITSVTSDSAQVGSAIPMQSSGVLKKSDSLSSLSSSDEEALGTKESLGSKLKRKLHIGKSSATTIPASGFVGQSTGFGASSGGMVSQTTTTQTTQTVPQAPMMSAPIPPPVMSAQIPAPPMMSAQISQAQSVTAAKVFTEAPIIKNVQHTAQIADVKRKETVLIEERPIIQQNITKPVIEVHERHIERTIPEAPILKQQTAPTVIQEIGRENLAFTAPMQTFQTQNIQEASSVTNIKVPAVITEIHNRPVIEKHEQLIIHERREQPITEVVTQPIVQNIYEKPVIVKSSETIVERSAPMLATSTLTSTSTSFGSTGLASTGLGSNLASTGLGTGIATTGLASTGLGTGNLNRRGSVSSVSSSDEEEALGKESLGTKLKRKLHVGRHRKTGAGTTDLDFDPDKKYVQNLSVSGNLSGLPTTAVLPQQTSGVILPSQSATLGGTTTTTTTSTTTITEKPSLKDRVLHRLGRE